MAVDGSHYILDNLMPGERLIQATRVHPLVMVPSAVIASGGFLFGAAGLAVGGPGYVVGMVGLLTSFVAAFLALTYLIEHLTTEFSCTDRRIVIKSGFLTTRVREMPLSKVEALLIERSLFGKMLGYGTVIFKGSGGTRRTCGCIEDPSEFYRQVQGQVATAQRSPDRGRA